MNRSPLPGRALGRRATLLASVLGASILGAWLSSCVGKGGTMTMLACPSRAVFTGLSPDGGPSVASVSEYMARRCGTLDCHGSVSRPMRLYGRLGLREPSEKNVSGGKDTTLLELQDNYDSVCNLQPEQTSAAVANQFNPEGLLVVQKARGLEAHKGGAVVIQGDPDDNCIAGWLRGDTPATVAANCQTAINGL